jgi:hypothetical protein
MVNSPAIGWMLSLPASKSSLPWLGLGEAEKPSPYAIFSLHGGANGF